MFLIIDNTEDEKVIFYFLLNNKLAQQAFEIRKDTGLLFCLDKLLFDNQLKLVDIKLLGVVVGEGKFTASRLAVTAANTLAYSLKIPIVALPKNFDETYALKLAESAVVGQYIVPTYSAEARVSFPADKK